MIVRVAIGILLMVCVMLALSGCTIAINIPPAPAARAAVAPAGPPPAAGPNPCASINCNADPFHTRTGRIA